MCVLAWFVKTEDYRKCWTISFFCFSWVGPHSLKCHYNVSAMLIFVCVRACAALPHSDRIGKRLNHECLSLNLFISSRCECWSLFPLFVLLDAKNTFTTTGSATKAHKWRSLDPDDDYGHICFYVPSLCVCARQAIQENPHPFVLSIIHVAWIIFIICLLDIQ